jgi:hypothetical protein
MTEKVEEKKPEDWMSKRWRPAMGWLYMTTCTMDFIIFPVLWAIIQTATHQPVTQWNPITLQGAGLYHLAMGAICGVAAWSRGQEKMAGVNSGMGGSSMSLSTNRPSTQTPQRPMTRPMLPDTDMEDADRKIR